MSAKLVCLLMIGLCLSSSLVHGEWRAVYDVHPVTKEPQCLLKTQTIKLFDGQEHANVTLMLNKNDLFVLTDSNIDMSFQEMGIKVDGNKFVPLTKVMAEKNVVFEDFRQHYVAQLRRGSKATLGLGFWPSWPKSKLRKASFSLKGFTRAYDKFQQCVEDQP